MHTAASRQIAPARTSSSNAPHLKRVRHNGPVPSTSSGALHTDAADPLRPAPELRPKANGTRSGGSLHESGEHEVSLPVLAGDESSALPNADAAPALDTRASAHGNSLRPDTPKSTSSETSHQTESPAARPDQSPSDPAHSQPSEPSADQQDSDDDAPRSEPRNSLLASLLRSLERSLHAAFPPPSEHAARASSDSACLQLSSPQLSAGCSEPNSSSDDQRTPVGHSPTPSPAGSLQSAEQSHDDPGRINGHDRIVSPAHHLGRIARNNVESPGQSRSLHETPEHRGHEHHREQSRSPPIASPGYADHASVPDGAQPPESMVGVTCAPDPDWSEEERAHHPRKRPRSTSTSPSQNGQRTSRWRQDQSHSPFRDVRERSPPLVRPSPARDGWLSPLARCPREYTLHEETPFGPFHGPTHAEDMDYRMSFIHGMYGRLQPWTPSPEPESARQTPSQSPQLPASRVGSWRHLDGSHPGRTTPSPSSEPSRHQSGRPELRRSTPSASPEPSRSHPD